VALKENTRGFETVPVVPLPGTGFYSRAGGAARSSPL
jgi:hypothetical protein